MNPAELLGGGWLHLILVGLCLGVGWAFGTAVGGAFAAALLGIFKAWPSRKAE